MTTDSNTAANQKIEVIKVEHKGSVAIVTMNRPEHLNALSAELRASFAQTFDRLAADSSCEVIVLTGAGRAFTAGLDLKELGGEKAASSAAQAAMAERDLAEAMSATPQPIIGAVNGFAITGGFEIALLCDFLIASENASFADTHARVGVVPGWGLSQRLPRLIGINRAKEISLTGNFVSAQQALEWGLVNRVVPSAELLPTCEALALDITTTDPATRSEVLRVIDEGWHTTLTEGLQLELKATKAHDRKHRSASKVAQRRKAIQERGRERGRGFA